ncbi:putative bifunctional diguanylate cyclase/phosphodiesterase [Pseudoxanthomonas mexicana]|uniref:putative bifunctional diguanylate cyclase/phosphodiesterase n=1 Tax=Pseudoxanthomonas mexicana TaxID=128785 RepID=UPI00398BAC0C
MTESSVLQGMDAASLLDALDIYVHIKDANGHYLYANRAVCELFGVPRDQIVGQPRSRFIHPDRLQGEQERRVLQEGAVISEEEVISLADGTSRRLWTIKAPLRESGRIVGLYGFSIDLARRPGTVADNWVRNKLMATILSSIDAHVYLKDHQGRYEYVNDKVAGLYNRPPREIIGHTDHELHPAEVANQFMEMDAEVLNTGRRIARQEVVLDADGEQRYFWSIKIPMKVPGQPDKLVGFSSEITELLELRRSLEHERTIDGLTGLGNRSHFEAELAVSLQCAAVHGRPLAVVMLGLDRFKMINGSLGHEVGDRILREVAERMRGIGPDLGTGAIARLSGDVFACILTRIESPGDAAGVAESLRRSMARPFFVGERQLHLTASVGISLYPADGRDPATLLHNAESAMHHAKDRGHDQCHFYSPELGAAISARAELERDLRAAVAARQFMLHYQPKVRSADGGIAGVEALLRWQRPAHGMVSPAVFIPLTEQLGLIAGLEEWVIEQACGQLVAWSRLGLGDTVVAVNVSAQHLASPALVTHVAACLQRHPEAQGRLEMEVTESVMIDNPEQAIVQFDALRALGIRLAIDDFGTGYSSLTYLKHLPVSTLKLDRSFIEQIEEDARSADLCAGIISLAHMLDLEVVAEGVETTLQRDLLAAQECDLLQGFLYSRPLPADEITRYLLAHAS